MREFTEMNVQGNRSGNEKIEAGTYGREGRRSCKSPGISFHKMHGLGNDFVIIDCRSGKQQVLSESCIVRLADRREGVGFDQIVHLLAPTGDEADVVLEMYNSDGSFIETCGNAIRCAAWLLMKESGRESVRVKTHSGIHLCSAREGGRVCAEMGEPRLQLKDIPYSGVFNKGKDSTKKKRAGSAGAAVPAREDGKTVMLQPELPPATLVNMGNPHAVIFLENLCAPEFKIEHWGPLIENDVRFPNRTNVEFAALISPDTIRMRVWERGGGLTRACGSGACAVLVAAVCRGLVARKAVIVMDGGELFVEWSREDSQVRMTGPVSYVFDGWLQTV